MTAAGEAGRRSSGEDGERAAGGSYRPSPRPVFDGPAHITADSVTRHVWGDPEAGEVADWIYVSSDYIHALVFGLAPHGSFRHSPDHRTIFGADELLYVLEGVMALANPETGEVYRVEAGESAFFRRDTWHHAFAHGEGRLRVLELFAPPPATGASGAYARTKPYLGSSRYSDDDLLGGLVPGLDRPRTIRPLGDRDLVWRRDLGVLVGLYVSTEHLTAGLVEVDAGQKAAVHGHGGDEILYVTAGRLTVRAWQDEKTSVFEVGPHEACYLPVDCEHEYANFGDTSARAVFAVAPAYAR
jgi:quercetin dioxygenase-like cupin family protein